MINGPAPHVVLTVENVSLARDHRLRKQARTLIAAGYRVTVICRRDPENRAPAGARLLEYPAPRDATTKAGYLREYGQSLVCTAWLLARLWCRDRFHAVQVSGTPDLYFLLTAPLRRLGCRAVLDQRDLSPELFELRYGYRGLVHRALCGIERASQRHADQVIVVNASLADMAVGRGGVPPEKVTIVGNGPELASVIAHPRAGHRVPAGRYMCVWLGMMGRQDQVVLAVDAIHHLVNEIGRTDCHFVFIGDGEDRERAADHAADRDVADFVTFTGWLPQEQAFALLAGADLAIEPNLEDIVSPVKLFEYMAFGLATVAFDAVETVRLAGDAAVYAPRGDTAAFGKLIDELLEDPQRRRRMGNAGRDRIRTGQSWDRQRAAYLAVYRRLLGEGLPDHGGARRTETVRGEKVAP